MFLLPDIRVLGGGTMTPCVAYLGGSTNRDEVRLIGLIHSDGSVDDVTVHGPFGSYGVDVGYNRLYGA